MATIDSDFVNLGKAGRAEEFAEVCAALTAFGFVPPAAENIPPGILKQTLKDAAGVLVAREINNDPMGVGYAGMTNAQIADALNNWRPADPKIWEANAGSRVSNIFKGFPFAPNTLTELDVKKALA